MALSSLGLLSFELNGTKLLHLCTKQKKIMFHVAVLFYSSFEGRLTPMHKTTDRLCQAFPVSNGKRNFSSAPLTLSSNEENLQTVDSKGSVLLVAASFNNISFDFEIILIPNPDSQCIYKW